MSNLKFLFVLTALASTAAADIKFTSRPIAWQQVQSKPAFHFFIERELYTSLDRTVRMVFASEGEKLDALSVRWSITPGSANGEEKIPSGGGVDVTFPVSQLQPGKYVVKAQLLKAGQVIAEKSSPLRYEQKEAPAASGKVPLVLTRGNFRGWPVHAGVPFSKGVLLDPRNVRVIDAAGKEVDSDVVVRGRWDSSEQGSIRWLGVEFQPGDGAYQLEFGPKVARAKPASGVKVAETPEAISIDTGAATFKINRKRFNVLDEWKTSGGTLAPSHQDGLYLIDHEGATYRAANDKDVDVRIEEQSAMHVVVRAAGWYVKDGASLPGAQNLTLPTDKLCRFVTRIEAYAGKPYVRVTNTLIVTFDTFSVRLRDAGMSLAFAATDASFGVEGAKPQAAAVGNLPGGVRGLQHLHDAFTIEDGESKSLAEAKHSAGWVTARNKTAAISLSLRDTWQRYPKEFEVLPDAVKLHVWPAHGREHPQINQTARNQIHRLLFAHQGKELSLATPWSYYFAAATSYGKDEAPGVKHVYAAVESSALGVATTSDVLLQLGKIQDEGKLAENALLFQVAPHAVADPKWTCDSLALGYIHPYDPKTFPSVEEIIHNDMRGYWKYQDMGQMFGMWIYRSWLHSQYNGNGAWELYRLYNGSHHHEAVIPWLLYARSGDPFYLTQGMANIRQFTDVQMVHHADSRYTHRNTSTQNQVVGATKHVNFVPWGWDHEIMGHQVCYNAPITAYYLTGDLRCREVVVDEWLSTLLGDRLNPEYGRADLSGTVFPENPRDNSVVMSEVIDAYELTYDPRLLVYMAPRYDIWINSPGCMGTSWGQPLHHQLLFRGSEQVREKLLAGVSANRARDFGRGKPIAMTLHAAQEMLAIAGIVDPQNSWAIDAFTMSGYSYMKQYSWNRITGKTNDVFCNTGEFVLFLPRMMYAVAHGNPDAAPVIGAAQAAARNPDGPTRVVVREDVDQTFSIFVNGEVKQEKGFDIQVFDPAGAQVARGHVGTGYQAFKMTVPSDGKTGQYVIFMDARQNDMVFAPYTSLPEVYCATYWTGNNDAQRYFTRAPAPGTASGSAPQAGSKPILSGRGEGPDSSLAKTITLTVTPQSAPSTILAPDQTTELANSQKGEPMKVDVGPEGVWIWNRACYITTTRDNDQPAILSVNPQRWFMPVEKSLALQPAK